MTCDHRVEGFAVRILTRLREVAFGLKDALAGHRGLRSRRHLTLVEALPLGNRRQMFLIACDGQRFLVGASADGIGSVIGISEAAQDFQTTGGFPRSERSSWRATLGHRGELSLAASGLRLVHPRVPPSNGAQRTGEAEAGPTRC